MVEPTIPQIHIEDIALPFLNLEVFADPELPEARVRSLIENIRQVWPHFLRVAEEEKLYESLPLNIHHKVVDVELTLTFNPGIRTLNRQYRGKDEATDVLTFTLLADAPNPELWLSLPLIQLGSIFISVEWAEAQARDNPEINFEHYIAERFIHGMLHLVGQHHDNMPKYHKVVAIQQRSLQAAFGQEAP